MQSWQQFIKSISTGHVDILTIRKRGTCTSRKPCSLRNTKSSYGAKECLAVIKINTQNIKEIPKAPVGGLV
jgi:hypothetical protein